MFIFAHNIIHKSVHNDSDKCNGIENKSEEIL